MTHTLNFSRRYRSITSFEGIELPDIVILTGKNGSGKSHLLEAIYHGAISTSASVELRKDISLFDWNTIVPIDTGSYSIGERAAKLEQAQKKFVNAREQMLSTIQQNIEAQGLDGNLAVSLEDLRLISEGIFSNDRHSELTQRTASTVISWMQAYGNILPIILITQNTN